MKDLSRRIVKDPYKIPMLALYFDLSDEMTDPGDYIHGIISRPLDEDSFYQDLFTWRLTASMWRRVALTMEVDGDNDVFPKLDDLPEELQEVFNTNASMKVRRRGSLFAKNIMENQTDIMGVDKDRSNPGYRSPRAPAPAPDSANKWQNIVSNYDGN